jgi:DNA-binding NarL/FixJ family response regulator
MTMRLLLVDDHGVVRAGLRRLLAAEPDVDIVGEADSGESAIKLALMLRPDVVVADLPLPDLDGISVTRRIRAELDRSHVLILTSVHEEDAAMISAVRAGAIGYLVKSADASLLVDTIRMAARGQVHLSHRAAARLMHQLRSPTPSSLLTARERQVLREMATGRANKEIARSLQIAETTVKSHVAAILAKFGLESGTQAAVYGKRADMLKLDDVPAA